MITDVIPNFRPLLAATAELDKIKFPVLVSPKLDGIRCLVHNGVGYSRSLKRIPNDFVQSVFASGLYDGLDGELIVGAANAPDVYRTTNSGVMSRDGEPDFRFHAFDRWDTCDQEFKYRLDSVYRCSGVTRVEVVPQDLVHDMGRLEYYEEVCLNQGYEGVMGRALNGGYKMGRSTVKDGILWKLKRFVDHEFQVVGFEERLHNANESFTDELGRTKRSSHQENKVGRGDLGALILDHPAGTFTCGTGFTDELRREIWGNRDAYLGQWVKVKHFEIGVKHKPRFPVFISFRDERDMS